MMEIINIHLLHHTLYDLIGLNYDSIIAASCMSSYETLEKITKKL